MRRETKSFPPGATDFLFSSDPEKEEERGKKSLFLFLFFLPYFPVSLLLLQQEMRNGEKKEKRTVEKRERTDDFQKVLADERRAVHSEIRLIFSSSGREEF